MKNWQVGQAPLDCDANSRGTLLHLNALCINFGITTRAFDGIVGRKDERLSMEGDRGYAWEEDWFTISVGEFVQCSSDSDDLVNFGDIPNRNITLHVVDKITAK
jgi:hypothetical protein